MHGWLPSALAIGRLWVNIWMPEHYMWRTQLWRYYVRGGHGLVDGDVTVLDWAITIIQLRGFRIQWYLPS